MPPVRIGAPVDSGDPGLSPSPPLALFRPGAPLRHAHFSFPSPDRRVRPRLPRTAANRNSGEQSPAEGSTPKTTATPSTSPRHADHAGEIRASWNTVDRRKRVMPTRRRRAPPPAGTLTPAGLLSFRSGALDRDPTAVFISLTRTGTGLLDDAVSAHSQR